MNVHGMIRGSVTFVMVSFLSASANAGIWDAINTASQAVSTAENAKNTAQRAGALVPKSNKPKRQPQSQASSDPVEVTTHGSMTPKDKAAIEKAKRAWVAAFKAEDWDSLVDNYAEDAVLLPPDELAVTGREAIRAYYGTDDDTSNEVFQTVSMGGDSHIVYAQGEFSFTIQSGDEAPADVSGKYIEIWEKQDDGNWLITHDIFNSNPVQ